MIDTDMIASPNYVRFVYDGNGDELGTGRAREGSGTVEEVFKRYFHRRGMATLPQAFDGRSDYVGFINRGIPAGGIFAGAEVPKTPEQVALFGGVAGEQYDPCYHEECDNHRHRHGPAPGEDDERLRHGSGARTAAGRRAERERAEVAARDVGRGHPRGLVLRADPQRPAAARRSGAHARARSARTRSSSSGTTTAR